MRLYVLVFAFAAGVVFATPAAIAQEKDPAFPDLPGMGLAEDATRGRVAPSQSTRHEDPGVKGTESRPKDDKTTAEKAPDTSSVAALPGAGAISVIPEEAVGDDTDLTSSGTKTPRAPLGLATFAALGTIVSLGSLWLLRDRLFQSEYSD